MTLILSSYRPHISVSESSVRVLRIPLWALCMRRLTTLRQQFILPLVGLIAYLSWAMRAWLVLSICHRTVMVFEIALACNRLETCRRLRVQRRCVHSAWKQPPVANFGECDLVRLVGWRAARLWALSMAGPNSVPVERWVLSERPSPLSRMNFFQHCGLLYGIRSTKGWCRSRYRGRKRRIQTSFFLHVSLPARPVTKNRGWRSFLGFPLEHAAIVEFQQWAADDDVLTSVWLPLARGIHTCDLLRDTNCYSIHALWISAIHG